MSVATAPVTINRNVLYAIHDGVPLYGDLYLHESGGVHPAVMFIHGGAWKMGSKDAYDFSWGPYLAERGYVVFAIDYRLATPTQTTWPQALLDCKAALQYLRGNAAELRVDADRIAVGGDSAGGQLSALLTLTQDSWQSGYPHDRYANVSTKVKAAIPAYGIFHMPAWWEWTKKGFKSGEPEYTALEEFFGGTPAELSRAYYEASPIAYVRNGAKSPGNVSLPSDGLKAAWFVTWGAEDPVVPAEGQSIPFAKALREAGVDVTAVAVPNAGHFWFKSSLTGLTGTPTSCVVKQPGNFVVCEGASPNDFIAADLVEFLRNKL